MPPLQTIDFKITSLTVVTVVPATLDVGVLAAAIAALPGGGRRFFDGEAAVLDLAAIADDAQTDWPALLELLGGQGVQPVAFCNAAPQLAGQARAAGLVSIEASEVARPGRPRPSEATPAPTPAPTVPAALIVDKPLRSGQRVYARGGDLVVTAMVSNGAELIADGCIHVYAPLRGRALAGASGDDAARIFCTCFEPELVSVAGIYRTFEDGLTAPLARGPAQVRLTRSGEGEELRVEPLTLG